MVRDVRKEPLPGESGFVEEYLVPPGFDADGVQSSSAIGKDGKEYPDPVPMAPPVGYDQPPSLQEMIRQMVRSENFRLDVERAGFGSFEEEDDFDISDDPVEPHTEYERVFDFEVPEGGPPTSEPPPPPPKPQQTGEGREGGDGGASPQPAPTAPPAPPKG